MIDLRKDQSSKRFV